MWLRKNWYFTQGHTAGKWESGFESRTPKYKCSLPCAMLAQHTGNSDVQEVPDWGLAHHLPQ